MSNTKLQLKCLLCIVFNGMEELRGRGNRGANRCA